MIVLVRGVNRWIAGPSGLILFSTQTFIECLLHARHGAELHTQSDKVQHWRCMQSGFWMATLPAGAAETEMTLGLT